MSQEELGYKAGLHRTYISDIERGTRNVSLCNFVRLARALGIEPWVLMSWSELAMKNGSQAASSD
jgi:transcriptional regulator with XRE-family HTH domain